ncbi:hypothetical protein [Chamaesiphon polymorphus]|uniref:Uncharacterized protein n=1 Tax=Chamaesiphon polymorphus CCALA 037 TaxID=2107692 RepID=A0A2T1F7H9_9CYAN|nr:hypothetical protein [Chamaesiphon polymorphus]PSB40868.1 hypothetical protein C7B77_27915 [Chamaesiphon polymorphus CCALA 037]
MEQTTALNHAISKLALNRSFANYHIQADDPIRDVTGMLDRIEQIKDAIPQAVTQSLDLAGKKLETQFELVSNPLLATMAVQQGYLGAVGQQLASLEKRFITTGHVAAPSQSWKTWLLIGCSFTILGLAGFNTLTNAWAVTPAGTLAKQMIDRNPKLANNCRPLTTRELKDLGAKNQARKICSIFL